MLSEWRAHFRLCTSHLSLTQRSARHQGSESFLLEIDGCISLRAAHLSGTARVVVPVVTRTVSPLCPLVSPLSFLSSLCLLVPFLLSVHPVVLPYLFFPPICPAPYLVGPAPLSSLPGSAGGVPRQPRHHSQWGEQRGGDGTRSQHQEGSLPRGFQPGGVRAPSSR